VTDSSVKIDEQSLTELRDYLFSALAGHLTESGLHKEELFVVCDVSKKYFPGTFLILSQTERGPERLCRIKNKGVN